MTWAARRAALRRWAVSLPVILGLAGCANLPFFGENKTEGENAAASAPLVEQFRLEIAAPAPLDDLLRKYLDVGRFQKTPSSEAITVPELDRLLATAPAQARELLETEGYFNAEVRAERAEAEAGGLPLVRVVVVPGPRTLVDDVRIEATGELEAAAQSGNAAAAATLASFRSFWPLKRGEPFRQGSWNEAKNETLAHLRSDGYAAAAWTRTVARVDAESNRAQLEVVAESGPLFRLGEIRVEGLQRYDAEAARLLADFPPGVPYREQTLLDYQERLVKSGLFEGATVAIEPDPATAGATPVLVKVKESTLQQATVGVGYSANTGARATLDHFARRVFDQPWILHDKLELGTDLKSIGVGLTSYPLANLQRNLAGANYERLRASDEIRTSWNARLGRSQDVTGRRERTYYLEAAHARVDNPSLVTDSDAISARLDGVLRDVDNILLPTRGFTLNAQGALGYGRGHQTEQAIDQTTNASEPFVRAYGRFTWYQPFGNWYVSTRLEAGQVFVGNPIAVPDTLLFRAGGDDSVRGYGYRTLGPTIGGVVASGRVLATGSAEVAHPISPKLPSLWWALFLDAGNAADRWQDLHAVLGYGVGLRWRSPVGPLKLDLAYGQEVDQFRLHMTVGIAF